jgi:hypothetical protein
LGTYVLYLYLKFHLLPYVKTFSMEDIEWKLNPVSVIVLSTKEEENIDLLGYDRNALTREDTDVVEAVKILQYDEDKLCDQQNLWWHNIPWNMTSVCKDIDTI